MTHRTKKIMRTIKSIEKIREEVLEKHKLVKKQKTQLSQNLRQLKMKKNLKK